LDPRRRLERSRTISVPYSRHRREPPIPLRIPANLPTGLFRLRAVDRKASACEAAARLRLFAAPSAYRAACPRPFACSTNSAIATDTAGLGEIDPAQARRLPPSRVPAERVARRCSCAPTTRARSADPVHTLPSLVSRSRDPREVLHATIRCSRTLRTMLQIIMSSIRATDRQSRTRLLPPKPAALRVAAPYEICACLRWHPRQQRGWPNACRRAARGIDTKVVQRT